MVRKISQVGNTTIEYFVHGVSPRLLIHAGTHGDEFEVIDSVKKTVEKYKDRLPDFVFVPVVSPSAVAKHTRNNHFGHDLNRSFFPTTTDEEALANMQIASQFHFDFLVSFHEDVEYSLFYLYDSGKFQDSDAWNCLQLRVKQAGVSLLTGVDDELDPALGYVFVDGYGVCPLPAKDTDGSFEHWAQLHGIVEEWIMPEIPSTLKRSVKDTLCDAVFKELVVTVFQEPETIQSVGHSPALALV